jgi:hypothetical protein
VFTASKLLVSKWPTLNAKNASALVPLSYIDCVSIDKYLSDDGACVSYSALVSVGDAIRGIEAGFYSWSVVKLYYSVFYSLRALLAFSHVAVFYVGTSPFWVLVRPGERPHPGGSSSSHKVILELFRGQFKSSPLLSQSIGFDDPLRWLQNQRETVNYKQAKFSEPGVPPLFTAANQSKSIRTLISAYMKDNLYAFDPDHAILAYPIAVLKELKRKNGSLRLFDETEQSALQAMICDSFGPITLFDSIIRA